MSSSPSKAPSAAGPSWSSLPCSSSGGEVEQDQLAFTIESPSLPQLQLFENIFNTGKSLAAYCRDDPLWPILAAVALPCSNCTKHPETCKSRQAAPVPLFCSALQSRFGLQPAILGAAWYSGAAGVLDHSGGRLTSVLMELNMLDDQDSQAVDRSELRRFQEAQEQEALLAARRKRVTASPLLRVRSKKRRLTKVVEEPIIEEVSRLVRLVIPPSRPAPSAPGSAPSVSKHLSAALPLVSAQATGWLGSVQDPSPLA
ncbi:MAG: hypothetical protein NXY57DRAFT_1043156 [Lentinula lateritia]|nr:MAG: hypothetical protein NXY57DRAFT_1043156 [Lentinula lateritia]